MHLVDKRALSISTILISIFFLLLLCLWLKFRLPNPSSALYPKDAFQTNLQVCYFFLSKCYCSEEEKANKRFQQNEMEIKTTTNIINLIEFLAMPTETIG